MQLVGLKELARELGVLVAVKKDSSGNPIATPLFPERKHKKSK
jgi:hypothetical protein